MKKILHSTMPLGMGIFYYSMFLIFFSLLILLFTSCASEKKSLQKAQNRVIQSGTLSDLCAKFFPPNLAYKAGDTVVKYEYQYLPGQVITRVKNDTTQIERVDTVYKIKTQLIKDTITIELTDKINASEQRNKALVQSMIDMSKEYASIHGAKDKATSQRNWAYGILSGIILLLAGFIFLKGKIPFI